jgi:hypothetical protein
VSDDDARIKRPEPERTEPLRAWSMLFGAGGRRAGARTSEGDRTSLNEVVSRSVDLGYRVVDEYIRQGQRAAQRLSDRSFGPDVVVTEVREVADRMTQYTSDVLALWFDMLELAGSGIAARGAGVGSPHPPVDPAVPPAEPAETLDRTAQERTRVVVEVVSPHPTEVSLDLRPEAPVGPLVAHGLRAADPEKPRLTDLTLEAGAPFRLRIRVPPEQPEGLYSGLIIEERTSRPVGTVTVRITRT